MKFNEKIEIKLVTFIEILSYLSVNMQSASLDEKNLFLRLDFMRSFYIIRLQKVQDLKEKEQSIDLTQMFEINLVTIALIENECQKTSL